jgi:hypothetical protein
VGLFGRGVRREARRAQSNYCETRGVLVCSPSLREGVGGRAASAPSNADTSAIPGGREQSGATTPWIEEIGRSLEPQSRLLSFSGLAVSSHDRWFCLTGLAANAGASSVARMQRSDVLASAMLSTGSLSKGGIRGGAAKHSSPCPTATPDSVTLHPGYIFLIILCATLCPLRPAPA